jgi:hypothetical protein
MSSESKIEPEKGAFQFPALVCLTPKRRFRVNMPPANDERTDLFEDAPRPPHRRRLKRTGRVVLRWPSPATDFSKIPPAPLTAKSYAP